MHLFDLRSRKDSVLRTGNLSPVFLAGDVLGWREEEKPDAPPVLKAVSVRTGEPVQLPPAITGIADAAHITGDGRTWTWVSPDYQTLHAWRPEWPGPAVVAKAGDGEHIDQVELAGDIVTWLGGKAVWAADLRTHSRTTLTPEYGGVVASGDALLVTYLTAGYSKDPAKQAGNTSYVLRASELPPLPPCAS